MQSNNDLSKSIKNHERCVDKNIYAAKLLMLESELKTEKAMGHIFPPGPGAKKASERLEATILAQIKDYKNRLEEFSRFCKEPT